MRAGGEIAIKQDSEPTVENGPYFDKNQVQI
jgi:hypothetical protein